MINRDKDIENCIPNNPVRNRYFFGKMMTVQDFEAESGYIARHRWLSHRLLSGRGILFGLDVGDKSIDIGDDGQVRAKVKPGVAIDGWGRTIVVSGSIEDEYLPVEGSMIEDGSYDLLLEFDEQSTHPVPALVSPSLCEESCQDNRMEESFRLRVREALETSDGPDYPAPDQDEALIQKTVPLDEDAVRITRTAPRYIYDGETFAVRLHIEPRWENGRKVLKVDELGGTSSVRLLGAFITDGEGLFLSGDNFVDNTGKEEGAALEGNKNYDLVYYLKASAGEKINVGHGFKLDDTYMSGTPTTVEVITGLKEDRVLSRYERRKYETGHHVVSEPGVCIARLIFNKSKNLAALEREFLPTRVPSNRMLLGLLKHEHDHVPHASQANNTHMVDGYHASPIPSPNTVPVLDKKGKLPPGVLSEADTVDGFHASSSPKPDTLLSLDGNGKLGADITGDAVSVGGFRASSSPKPDTLLPLDGNGKLGADITGDADTLDGMHVHEILDKVQVASQPLKLNGILVYDKISGVVDSDGDCRINAPNPVTIPLDNRMVYLRGSIMAQTGSDLEGEAIPELGDPLISSKAAISVENESTAWRYIPFPIVWQNPDSIEAWARSDPGRTVTATIGPLEATFCIGKDGAFGEKDGEYRRANMYMTYTVGKQGFDFDIHIRARGKEKEDIVPEGTPITVKYKLFITWEDVKKGTQNAVIYMKKAKGNPVVRVVKFSGKLDIEKGINAIYPDANPNEYGVVTVENEILAAMFQRDFESQKKISMEWETQVETHNLMSAWDDSLRARVVMVGKPVNRLLWARDGMNRKKVNAKLLNTRLGVIDVSNEKGIIEVGCEVTTRRAVCSEQEKLLPNFNWKKDAKGNIVGVDIKKKVEGEHLKMEHPEMEEEVKK